MHYLTGRDFGIYENQTGQMLFLRIDGVALVLFYITKCEYCREIIPSYKDLGVRLNGCTVCMVNVAREKNLIRSSKRTLTPIGHVPTIFLFIGGFPHAEYPPDAPRDARSIARFVLETINEIREEHLGGSGGERRQRRKRRTWNLGIPYNALAEIYAKFLKAYANEQGIPNVPCRKRHKKRRQKYEIAKREDFFRS